MISSLTPCSSMLPSFFRIIFHLRHFDHQLSRWQPRRCAIRSPATTTLHPVLSNPILLIAPAAPIFFPTISLLLFPNTVSFLLSPSAASFLSSELPCPTYLPSDSSELHRHPQATPTAFFLLFNLALPVLPTSFFSFLSQAHPPAPASAYAAANASFLELNAPVAHAASAPLPSLPPPPLVGKPSWSFLYIQTWR